MTTLLTVKRIAELYFDGSAVAARKFIQRQRLRCELGREGPRDARLYNPERVQAALAGRVGRGYRSDLRGPQDSRERA